MTTGKIATVATRRKSPVVTFDPIDLRATKPREGRDLRVQYRVPDSVQRGIYQALLDESYGVREYGRWVDEAINLMLDAPVNQDFCNEDGTMLRHAAYKPQILEMAMFEDRMVKGAVSLPMTTWRRAWHAMVSAMLYGDALDEPEYPAITLSDVIRVAALYRIANPLI